MTAPGAVELAPQLPVVLILALDRGGQLGFTNVITAENVSVALNCHICKYSVFIGGLIVPGPTTTTPIEPQMFESKVDLCFIYAGKYLIHKSFLYGVGVLTAHCKQ